ncbi:MAG: UDP-3-O-acyl-N-acetylglucosamine deacetylase [Nitrospira sp.]|nr:UDP-3-O-acyl-N-acetylglucosamine deacetylase [Nitrospira sp.]MEB2337410.1 UDP-3-O-acyl-N-acetylglucosamine deacetylase [Nitrospirales bacterium]
MRFQQTIGSSISCSGVGLHSGQPVTMTLRPAPPNTGIVFVCKTGSDEVLLPASVTNKVPTELCTAISSNGRQVKTIEHVLAALAGMEIDNVYVEVDAGEVPVLDGSASPFVHLIRTVGAIPQSRRQSFVKITQPIEVVDGAKRVRIEPSSTPKITYSIHYDHPMIQTQSYTYAHSAAAFEREISAARTFGFLHEVEALWSRGLGKGGNLDNTVVLSQEGVVNQSGLRFPNEFVRHKVLDLIGDVALLGFPFIGHIVAERSGHAMHTKLVEQILAQRDKWVLITAESAPVAQESRPSLGLLRPAPSLAI